jgi:hypothetical protein
MKMNHGLYDLSRGEIILTAFLSGLIFLNVGYGFNSWLIKYKEE